MKLSKELIAATEIGKGCAGLMTDECREPHLRVLAAACAALVAIRSTPEENRPAAAAALYHAAYAYCEWLSYVTDVSRVHERTANPRSKPDKDLLELRKLAGLQ